MRNVSSEFLTEIIKPSRTVDSKIVIGGSTTITSDDIISYTIKYGETDTELPTIGSAVASSIKMEITNNALPLLYVGQKIEVYSGLEVDGVVEWIKIGTFKTSNEYVVKNKLTTEIEAFDEIYWLNDTIFVSNLTYPASLTEMINELELVYEVEFSEDLTELIMFHIDPTEEDYSIRSILSQMALLTSANVITDSDGKIVFKFLRPTDFHITGDNYIEYNRLSETDISINQLSVTNSDLEQTFVSGSSVGVGVSVENTGIISQEQTDGIRNRIYPLVYTPYNMVSQGMPHIEVGDTILFTEVDSTLVTLFVLTHTLTYNGGFKSIFSTKAPEKEKIETTPFRNASATITNEALKKTNKTLQEAITEASNLITGNNGGHIVTIRDEITGKPEEILILVDSDDVNTASQLWRWNAGGLGFSSTGYNGSYDLAMTSNGKIVASAIDASELSAITARLGTVTAGRIQDEDNESYWDLDGKVIKLNVNELKITGNPVATQSYADTQLTNFATVVDGDISDLQTQVDGKITTWFYAAVPTAANVPASTWTTKAMKDAHLGDLYYNTSTGQAYRWRVVSTTYSWELITDNRITTALANAATAKDVADSKRRVFGSTPTAPYDVNDLWVQGTSGDIMRCITASTTTYSAAHWVKAVKYTDDTTANTNLATAKTYAEEKASDAQAAAEAVAVAKAVLAETNANAYADGIVSAEEQARIAEAEDVLTAAQGYADARAVDEAQAAKDYVDTVNAALATQLGTTIEGLQVAWTYDTVAPFAPFDNMIWVDTALVPNVPKRWVASASMWIPLSVSSLEDIGAYAASEGNALATNFATFKQSFEDGEYITQVIDSAAFEDVLSGKFDKAEFATEFAQNAESITASVATVKATADGTAQSFETITNYMDFSGDGLLLGESGSALQVNITNEELQFLNGTNKIAYMSGSDMYITKANITEKIKIGVHELEKHDANITILRWVGEDN